MYCRTVLGNRLVLRMTTDGCKGTAKEVNYLEHVQARVTLKSNRRGSVALFLTSPKGTKSQLLHFRNSDASSEGFSGWPFMTTHCWEEYPVGEWTFEVEASSHYSHVVLVKWDLVLHGTKDPPQAHPVHCASECDETNGCRGPTSTNCSQCFGLRGDDGKVTCVTSCPDKLYGDRKMKQCLVCHETCSSCRGPMDSDCLTCVQGKTLSEGKCLSGCAPGSFQSSNGQQINCSHCHSTCSECVGASASDCTHCKEGHVLHGSACTSQCPDGMFAETSSKQCVPCHKSCLTCDGAYATDCKVCHKGMLLEETTGQCLGHSSDGYYQSVASPCSSSSSSCSSFMLSLIALRAFLSSFVGLLILCVPMVIL